MTQAVCCEGMDRLKSNGITDIYVANDGEPNNYLGEMKDAEAIIVRIGKMDKNAISASQNLKVIGRTGVGYDSVDVEAATAAGIPVVITPSANARSVAEHTVALIFSLSKDLINAHTGTCEGKFSVVRNQGRCTEVLNKKAGFIGLGNIGNQAAQMCKEVGMEILGYDPFISKEEIEARGYTYYSDYEELIKEADFVSVHVPLIKSTRNMIAEKQLLSMKKTAYIVNCSRGGIVNEADLIDALNNDVIAGAALDVFECEPADPAEGDAILCAKNIIVTPHSAAQTREAVINMATMCIDGCLAVMNGEKWPYVADKKVYNHPKWAGK
jgi:D-3-phosphoglycerate dehydrogenase